MPYNVEKGGGSKPYKITKPGGKVVGSSTSKAKAESSVRARQAAEHGWKPTGKPKGKK